MASTSASSSQSFTTLHPSQPAPSLEYATVSDLQTAVDNLRTYMSSQVGTIREMLRSFEDARYKQDRAEPTLLRSVEQNLKDQTQRCLKLEAKLLEATQTIERLERLIERKLGDLTPTPTEAGGSPQPELPATPATPNGITHPNGEAHGTQAGSSATAQHDPSATGPSVVEGMADHSPSLGETGTGGDSQAGPSRTGQTYSNGQDVVPPKGSIGSTADNGPRSERKTGPPLVRRPKLGLPVGPVNGNIAGSSQVGQNDSSTNGEAGPSTRAPPDHPVSARESVPEQPTDPSSSRALGLAESARRKKPLSRAFAMDFERSDRAVNVPDMTLSGSIAMGNAENAFPNLVTAGLSASEASLLVGECAPTDSGRTREGRYSSSSAVNGDLAASRADDTQSIVPQVPGSGVQELRQEVAEASASRSSTDPSGSSSVSCAKIERTENPSGSGRVVTSQLCSPSAGSVKEESPEAQTTGAAASQANNMPNASSSSTHGPSMSVVAGQQLRRSQRTRKRRFDDSDGQPSTSTAAERPARGGGKRRKTRK